jgi:hypothetical protein
VSDTVLTLDRRHFGVVSREGTIAVLQAAWNAARHHRKGTGPRLAPRVSR